MFEPKNILVPTDFSTYSDAALKQAVELAVQFKSKIYLLHVIDVAIQQCAADYCLSNDLVGQLEEQSIKGATKKLEKESGNIIGANKLDVVFDVQQGNPSEMILKEQADKKIDLIVIASHGKTGILKNLIGGVADKVVKGAKCQVMVVRP